MQLIVVMVLAVIVIFLQVLVVMSVDLTPQEQKCFVKTYKDRCSVACSFARHQGYCCELSRCQRCYRDIGINQCGEKIGFDLLDKMARVSIEIKRFNCTDSEKYPSLKCLFLFNALWFYLIPCLFFTGTCLFYVLLKRRSDR